MRNAQTIYIGAIYFSPLWSKVLCATHRQCTLVPSTLVLYGQSLVRNAQTMYFVAVYFSPLWGKVLCATRRQCTLLPSTLVLYGAKSCAQRTIFSFFAELVYLTRQGGKRGGVGWLMPVVLFLWRVGCPSGQVEPMFNLADWLVDGLVLWGR